MGIQEAAGFEVGAVSVFFEASRHSCRRHFRMGVNLSACQSGEEDLRDVQAERRNSLVQSQ